MSKQHWMISIVRMMAILFVFSGCLLVFWYTPFYSNLVVKALNTFVPVNVDVVAAQSQQMAALTDHSDYEPGSRLWIARQAYLDLMEQAIQDKKTEDLVLIQTRYQILLDEIKEKLKNKSKQESKDTPKIPFFAAVDSSEISTTASQVEIDEQAESIQNLKESAEDKALRETYTQFLETHPVDPNSIQSVDDQTYKDIALIQSQGDKKKASSDPHAIVTLGGGLTLGSNKVDIVVNDYTRLRLEKTLEVEKESKLPIVLSGVEAPYMQAWLKNSGVEANLLENRSMNTCENTRFSSLLLQKKGGAPTVILITDRYHMPRTRRLFALNGIQTIPVEAPMPTTMTNWQPSLQNYDHSRRANYEMLASIRDVLFGSSGCREVP
mgnify:FL=1